MSKDFVAPPRSALPSSLTSYDFLKAAALLLMIVDHVGYYFFPEEQWMRVVGRFSAPIWLFLIGYARSRDLSVPMWAGMAILVLSNYVVGMPMLPVNILGTILLCRMVIDPLMQHIGRSPKSLYPLTAVFFFLSLPAFGLVEYGTSALLLVMAGYMVRNRDELPFKRDDIIQFAGIAGLLYGALQVVSFLSFDNVSRIVVAVGIMLLLVFLTRFRSYEYPALTAKIPSPVAWLVRLAGRRTLEFYVLHLLLFKAAAYYLGTQKTELFTFHIW